MTVGGEYLRKRNVQSLKLWNEDFKLKFRIYIANDDWDVRKVGKYSLLNETGKLTLRELTAVSVPQVWLIKKFCETWPERFILKLPFLLISIKRSFRY